MKTPRDLSAVVSPQEPRDSLKEETEAAPICAYGHKSYSVGCVSCVLLHRKLQGPLAPRAPLRQQIEEKPALVDYMNAGTLEMRSAAFLRTYAERLRNGTSATWEIPNAVASTLEDIWTLIVRLSDPGVGCQVVDAANPEPSSDAVPSVPNGEDSGTPYKSGSNIVDDRSGPLSIISPLSPAMCNGADPLTDAKCSLRFGHVGQHWGHGPIRTWSDE